MNGAVPYDAQDLPAMRALMARLGDDAAVVDLEEQMALAAVRAVTRVWRQDGQLTGFAYVDDFNNLCFESDPTSARRAEVEAEIMAWGVQCMQARNRAQGSRSTLDASCSARQQRRIELLERHGFTREALRSLHYTRSLQAPIADFPLPPGFTLRCAAGKAEAEALAALHRAAFGTEHMTVEYRLAMMDAPGYCPELDFTALAANGDLAAFCVGGFEDEAHSTGYTDPVGTHPRYQRLGLARALVTAGLRGLQAAGAQTARLGTSSENQAMQHVALACGFVCTSETLWFARVV